MRAPERNREHSIGDQVVTLNVGFMERLQKVWQDVYRRKTQAGEVYLKLTVIDDVLIVSFKEL